MGEHSIDLKHLISAPDYSIRMKEERSGSKAGEKLLMKKTYEMEVDVLNQRTPFKPLLKCSPTPNLHQLFVPFVNAPTSLFLMRPGLVSSLSTPRQL